jgi:hypothetical protein
MDELAIPDKCIPWVKGQATARTPYDVELLGALADANFCTYIGEGASGLIGATSGRRSFTAICLGYRTLGHVHWVMFFREDDKDRVTTATANLAGQVEFILNWLNGHTLYFFEDSLVASERLCFGFRK